MRTIRANALALLNANVAARSYALRLGGEVTNGRIPVVLWFWFHLPKSTRASGYNNTATRALVTFQIFPIGTFAFGMITGSGE